MKVVREWKTCESFPAEWDVWLDDGNYGHVRYRWGILTMEVAADEEEWHKRNYLAMCHKDFDRKLDGVMSTEAMKHHVEEFQYPAG